MSWSRRYKVADAVLARCRGQHEIEQLIDDKVLLGMAVHDAGGFVGDVDYVRRHLEDALDEYDYRDRVRRGG